MVLQLDELCVTCFNFPDNGFRGLLRRSQDYGSFSQWPSTACLRQGGFHLRPISVHQVARWLISRIRINGALVAEDQTSPQAGQTEG